MNKLSPLFFLIFYLPVSAQNNDVKNKFFLPGKIIGQQDGSIRLSYRDQNGKEIKDTCVLQNGKFYFTGNIDEPTLAMLKGDVKSIADDDPNSTAFYIEPNYMTAIVQYNHFKETKITGSKTQIEFQALQKKINVIAETDSSIFEYISQVAHEFIVSNPNSYVSVFELAIYQSSWSLDTIKFLYNSLTPAVRKSFYGKEVREKINLIDNNSPGRVANDFTTIDINGDSVSLSSFKGRYVLLDFWASWCIPCRESFPHLIELFRNYQTKGFEIIAISSDHDANAWKKAITKDRINIWHNILDLENDMNRGPAGSQLMSKKFGVLSLPTKFLIDRNGIIIGRYGGTGGESNSALDKKLKEIFE